MLITPEELPCPKIGALNGQYSLGGNHKNYNNKDIIGYPHLKDGTTPPDWTVVPGGPQGPSFDFRSQNKKIIRLEISIGKKFEYDKK